MGIIFLFCLGAAIDSGTSAIDFTGERSKATQACYIAGAVYIVFFLMSLGCLKRAGHLKKIEEANERAEREREQREEEEDIKLGE